jgi:EpsI family protein
MNVKATALLLAALMCGAAIAGVSLHLPQPPERPNFLETTVPEAFGDWKKVDEGPQIIDPGTVETLRKIYKEWLTRTYTDGTGYRIMLSVARSGNQIGIQAVHLPTVCYPAQGFEQVGGVDDDGAMSTPYGPISVTRVTMAKGSRTEPITYWLTMADRVVRTQWDKRRVQAAAIWTGESPDGLLFRVSSIDGGSEHAFAMQQKFVADLMKSLSSDGRHKLGGLTSPQS